VVKITLDQTSVNKFIATLQRFAAKTGQSMRDATLEQAALICQDAATFTPPMPKGGGRGLSKAAQTAGDNAVAVQQFRMWCEELGGGMRCGFVIGTE